MPFLESEIADFLLMSIIALILGHTMKLYYQKRWFALEPLNAFWVGIYMSYISPIISFENILRSWHADGVFEETLFWILFGFIWLIVGYELKIGVRLGRHLPRIADNISPFKLKLFGWLLVGLGFIGYIHLFESSGGFYAWVAVPRGGTNYEEIIGYLGQLADLLPAGISLLVFQVYIHPSSKLEKLVPWMLAALMLWWFIYLGTRSRTIMLTISLLAAVYLPKRKNPPLYLILSILLSLMIITKFQSNYRNYFTNLSFNLDQMDLQEAYGVSVPTFLGGSSASKKELVSGGLEINCTLSVVELVPSNVDYNYGYGHLEVFTRLIPRALWPNKIYPGMESVQGVLKEAQLSGAYVRDRDLLMGPAFSYIGHWYYVGGAVALVIAGIATGIFFRAIYSYYDYNSNSQGTVILYSLLIPIGFGEASTTPMSWVFTLPFILIPLGVVLRFSRLKRNS
ncbi:MAG: hypothetical protein CTY16_03075 [Methylobacter sp.]|nr:MAG: hypothetical protein CTY16_03075 [Methylobacter sp.]